MNSKEIWLPRDERKVLVFYALDIDKPNECKLYEYPELMKILGWCEGKPDMLERVWNANSRLQKLGLIYVQSDNAIATPTITLTDNGLDLGRKYAHWCSRTQLWFIKYKKHWIFLVLLWIFSLVVTGVVTWWQAKHNANN